MIQKAIQTTTKEPTILRSAAAAAKPAIDRNLDFMGQIGWEEERIVVIIESNMAYLALGK